jgi:DNA polymerase zeta
MNVLFGYTGATFSGRMPCSEIADSVVEISKYCLRKSIDYLNNHPKYKGKVLYGDTDSIFFHMPNYPLAETFGIGKQLSEEITRLFPYPMEMKFEKVYESLFLMSKKRYYGKSYETANSAPKYEGKGVETVRRDGIPFTSQAMSKILNELFDSKDLSKVKSLLLS